MLLICVCVHFTYINVCAFFCRVAQVDPVWSTLTKVPGSSRWEGLMSWTPRPLKCWQGRRLSTPMMFSCSRLITYVTCGMERYAFCYGTVKQVDLNSFKRIKMCIYVCVSHKSMSVWCLLPGLQRGWEGNGESRVWCAFQAGQAGGDGGSGASWILGSSGRKGPLRQWQEVNTDSCNTTCLNLAFTLFVTTYKSQEKFDVMHINMPCRFSCSIRHQQTDAKLLHGSKKHYQ